MLLLQVQGESWDNACTLRPQWSADWSHSPRTGCISRQLIQRTKCYQTVVRLGTYTGKVPIYNSLQACKGTMFFLPLPLNKTIETLNKVQQHTSVLPDPELYIIFNGRSTKSNVVWRSFVDVNHVKTAIRKLRSCNWLYRDVHEKCIDESTKHIIEVATTEMLKRFPQMR